MGGWVGGRTDLGAAQFGCLHLGTNGGAVVAAELFRWVGGWVGGWMGWIEGSVCKSSSFFILLTQPPTHPPTFVFPTPPGQARTLPVSAYSLMGLKPSG